MTEHYQTLPRNLVEEMLQLVARAICERPGESAAQRDSRANQMVHCTLGFAPRDGLELMLASLTIGHFHLILDSMRDVFQGELAQLKAKTKTTIVALDRAMLQLIKELRHEKRRPAARSAESAVAAPAPDPITGATERPASPAPEGAMPDAVQSGSGKANAAEVNAEAAASELALSLAAPSVSGPAPRSPARKASDIAKPALRNSGLAEFIASPDVAAIPGHGPRTEEEEAAILKRIAANEAFMAAMNKEIEEVWREHRQNQAAAAD